MSLEEVFKVQPNPRYVYMTPSFQAAIAKTHYVIRTQQGLTTIIGDVGLGKTSILRLMYNEYMDDPNVTAAIMVNPKQTSETAFLKAICTEFEVPTRRSQRETELELRNFLIQQAIEGKTVVLFIDEAQQLRGPMFEQIRQILNYETDDRKLLNIVMAGQVELRYKLADPSKRALVSRIAVMSNLDALTLEDTQSLIEFRCTVEQITNPFDSGAVEAVYTYSKGIPREIVKACAISIQNAILNEMDVITKELVEFSITDLIKPSELDVAKKKPVKTSKPAKAAKVSKSRKVKK